MRSNINRREFLKQGALATAALSSSLGKPLLSKMTRRQSNAGPDTVSGQPNIILIMVDQLRFPMVFPHGISTPDQFLAKFMPNLYQLLWTKGVKFSRYYTVAADCSPSRGAIVTGLYAQQTFMLATRQSFANPQAPTQPQPQLDTDFPTYGKLLRAVGYDTPYIGKWHLSNSPANAAAPEFATYLQPYGFQGLTAPDPLGLPGHGIGATTPPVNAPGATPPMSDAQIANQAVSFLQRRALSTNPKPFCLTVSLVNPHDKQFFWIGDDVKQYNAVYASIPEPPPLPYRTQIVEEANPPKYGYGQRILRRWEADEEQVSEERPSPYPVYGYHLPPNWESEEELAEKPKLQRVYKQFAEYFFTGGFSEDPAQTGFTYAPTPVAPGKHKAVAPFSYWARALDSYTQAMSEVDKQIGQVIQNIPEAFAENTVIVFTSDHGDYAGAHGLQDKGSTVYEEAIRVPLIIVEPGGRFIADTQTVRTQFASSVDLLPMLVSLGNGGSTDWMTGDFGQLYGRRANLLAILRDPGAPGRGYITYSTDEVIPASQNFLNAPEHVIGLITNEGKLGTYANWRTGTATPIINETLEKEYYDYSHPLGRNETRSTPDSRAAEAAFNLLLSAVIPNELQAPLPSSYRAAQARALGAYWQYVTIANASSA